MGFVSDQWVWAEQSQKGGGGRTQWGSWKARKGGEQDSAQEGEGRRWGSEGVGHGQALYHPDLHPGTVATVPATVQATAHPALLLARSLHAFCLLRRASSSASRMIPVTTSRERQSPPGRSQALVTTNRGRELTSSQGLWTSHLKSPLLGLLWRSSG